MSREEMHAKLNSLKDERFYLAMKDSWSRADFARDDELRIEIRKLTKEITERFVKFS